MHLWCIYSKGYISLCHYSQMAFIPCDKVFIVMLNMHCPFVPLCVIGPFTCAYLLAAEGLWPQRLTKKYWDTLLRSLHLHSMSGFVLWQIVDCHRYLLCVLSALPNWWQWYASNLSRFMENPPCSQTLQGGNMHQHGIIHDNAFIISSLMLDIFFQYLVQTSPFSLGEAFDLWNHTRRLVEPTAMECIAIMFQANVETKPWFSSNRLTFIGGKVAQHDRFLFLLHHQCQTMSHWQP